MFQVTRTNYHSSHTHLSICVILILHLRRSLAWLMSTKRTFNKHVCMDSILSGLRDLHNLWLLQKAEEGVILCHHCIHCFQMHYLSSLKLAISVPLPESSELIASLESLFKPQVSMMTGPLLHPLCVSFAVSFC